jgi:zinc protease
VESLFQLVHLYFTAPRRTEQAFANLLQSLRSNIENNRGNPLAALNRTLSSELWQNHPRVSPLSQALLDQADLDRALAIYRERFADAGDFAFFFVGNLDLQQMRLLAQTYLATLPSTGQPERRRDLGIRPSTGVVEKVVRLGTENISNTAMVFSGTYEYSERSALNLIGLGQLLNLRVITAIRTELGESYSPHATAATTLPPVSVYQVKVSFTSDPQNAERLAAIVLQQSEILRVAGPVAEEVAVLRAQGSFFYSSQLQDNGLWLSNLMARHAAGLELRGILDTPRLIDETTIESLRLSAQTFLNPENLVKVVQVPEDFGMSAVLERQQTSTPEALALEENYPNPFNGETVIHFSLPRRTTVELAVYNLAGQKVAVLVQGMREAGRYSVRWDARDQARRPLASGVYLYKLYAEGDVEGRRLLLLR